MGESVRKVTVNIPAETLERALTATGKGITATIVDGLMELDRREKRQALRRLKGSVDFRLDLEQTRQ